MTGFDMENVNEPCRILVTGATGYVGGRLLPVLEKLGHRVRCLARTPANLKTRVGSSTEIVRGDLLEPESLQQALTGIDSAYYLVHSMGSSGSFEEKDRKAAHNFAEAARDAGVKRIIYLGGLGDDSEALSPHLRSRHEVGRILRLSGSNVIEFRASIVIGSGSLSFEMIRSLVERLPVMITPRWISMHAQPIAIEDLLDYLTAALHQPESGCAVYEIGGADRVSYGDIMHAYARARNLRIRMIPVPVLTPTLSSLWLGLVTPLYARVGRKLIESIVHSTIVHNDLALKTFAIKPMGIDRAIRRALSNEDEKIAATRWSDAISSSNTVASCFGTKYGTRLVDSRSVKINVPPAVVFKIIQRIGGQTGWYAWNSLWRLRGILDSIAGGVGMRHGRSDPDSLRPGDVVDFWRVEEIQPEKCLRLAAEMKIPGRAWLEFQVEGDNNSSTIQQTAIFDPVGLLGQFYWYTLSPLHHLVFTDMLRGIADEAHRAYSPCGEG